ncbi:MAG TPA: ORF6N domain-containing protein [Chthoniobacterales bacterium]|nr:ORF6N domain-containing protein [Chthoniobacterales bacterium]
MSPRNYALRKIDRVDAPIYLVRGQRVMLDSDLAMIYGTTTTRLNEQFRRNRGRFPKDFAFQLTPTESKGLISQIATSKNGRGGRRSLPWVFTEHGAIMLASVLSSKVAIQASVRVVRAFVRLREIVAENAQLAGHLKELERRLDSHDEAIVELFAVLKRLLEPEAKPKREIGFHVREPAPRYRTRKRV